MEQKGRYEKLPNGATLFTDTMGELDYVVMQKDGNSIHIYMGDDTGEGANCDVVIYDNLKLKIYGWRKNRPRIVLEGDEFPCLLEMKDTQNIIIIEEEQS